jgi:hypothetical protein
VQRKGASDYFSSSKYTGPLTLNFEYASIIRIRNLSRLSVGVSSALKIEVCATPISRAAWARVLPAYLRKFLASTAKSFSFIVALCFGMSCTSSFFRGLCASYLQKSENPLPNDKQGKHPFRRQH